jgi:cell division protein FtsQ
MKKNWLYIVTFIIIIAGSFLLLSFTTEQRKKAVCEKIDVRILNNQFNQFLKKKDILSMLNHHNIKIKGEYLDNINTLIIENILSSSTVIRNVAAYTTVNGSLVIEVEQRTPVIRIIDSQYQQYFIDELGCIIPDRIEQVAHVLVANGNIPSIEIKNRQNIKSILADSSRQSTIVRDLYEVARFINSSEFWKAQIQQIYVNEKGEIVLIPMVGNHIILFGDGTNIKEKFVKLRSMYQVFNQIGWNQYKIINLKYNKQIICIKQ